MKVYLDVCCLNRPFDDQNQTRIRLESEAILIIMNQLYIKDWEWIGSDVLIVELENTPNIEKRKYLIELTKKIQTNVNITKQEIIRANKLATLGFKSFDAMHIACAESVNADIFLTTDDKLLKKSIKEKNNINIPIANPLSWLMEMI